MRGRSRHDRRYLLGIRLRNRYHVPGLTCAYASKPNSNRRSRNTNTPNTRPIPNRRSPNTDIPNVRPGSDRHAGLSTRCNSDTGPPRDSRIRSKP